ncbi:glycosyltransferase family 8 protein (plasmid) [Lactiplantibacillus plantarum]|uniref:glycosyltransferase family 8 protein n=1 Tax=Lactiplantibacillus plantarum TaxID=1590 RepID=UPI001019046A|nr:glycosyltransferase family 8 protein [Lactiplantibacillus plantarum]QBA72779.1 glycosyltransferase family 8 protein [Lactiplantibacillus plantarum]
MTTISIVSTTNTEFAQHLAIFYRSILVNDPRNDFAFYIFNDHLTAEAQVHLKRLELDHINCRSIKFLTVDEQLFQKAVTDERIIKAAYYRIYTAELLPELDRILYLDCDMICTGSLEALWNTSLKGNIIAAVEDAGYVPRLAEMNITSQHGFYFNSGVMLIDLKRWREEHITAKVMAFINQHPEQLKYHDQDALNAVLADKWYYLHPKYNMQSRLIRREQEHPLPPLEIIAEEARQAPILIHYSGRSKPWLEFGVRPHPLRHEYWKYAQIARTN